MFYRADGDAMFVAEHGAQAGIDDILPGCSNQHMFRLNVPAQKTNTCVGRGRVKIHRDLVSTVQAYADVVNDFICRAL